VKARITREPGSLPDGRGKRVCIVSARFYPWLSDWLEDGARRGLTECGVATQHIGLARVHGCFELPLAARRLIDRGHYDAIVAVGVVIQGETPHFDFVAGECARGIMEVQLATGIPVGFGVLTTDTLAQAEERADPAKGDRGYEAAVAALAVLAVG
jgi:6,7-dimethyl-8-ribityllumazine synthase